MKNLTTEFECELDKNVFCEAFGICKPRMICFRIDDCEDNQQRMTMIKDYRSKLMWRANIYNSEDLVIYMNMPTYKQLTKGYYSSWGKTIWGMEIKIDTNLLFMEFKIQEKMKEVDNMSNIVFDPYKIEWNWATNETKKDYLPSSYIINEGATILFYSCGKVISKRNKNDKFDKELGFLVAFFKMWWNGSKQSQKNVMNSVSDLKTFMFEFFVAKTEMSKEKARKYLANLKVEKK